MSPEKRLFMLRHVACDGLLVLLSRRGGGGAFLEQIEAEEQRLLQFGGDVVCSRCRRSFHLVLWEETEENEASKMAAAAAEVLAEKDLFARFMEEALVLVPAELGAPKSNALDRRAR